MMGWVFSFAPWVALFAIGGTRFQNDPENPIPTAWFFCQAGAYFLYRVLDEVDGKHARNTGNSSPMGMLLDHGVDAFSAGF